MKSGKLLGRVILGLCMMTVTATARAGEGGKAAKESTESSKKKTTVTKTEATTKSETKPAGAPNQAALEAAFAKKMTEIVLVGAFTVDGQKGKPPSEERYEIDSVKKLEGNLWVFNTRIKYGKTDVRVPLSLPLLWAGDTPMISMTDFTIPGMGTFSARVIFHGDRYVGTWQHGKVGGHMFGRIESSKKTPAK